MKPEVKKIERPKRLSFDYSYEIEKYCDQLEQERDELIKDSDELLKDNVKSEDHLYRELKKALKERDELQERLKRYEDDSQECCYDWKQNKLKELQDLKEAVRERIKDLEGQLGSILEYNLCDRIRDIINVKARTECEMLELIITKLKDLIK